MSNNILTFSFFSMLCLVFSACNKEKLEDYKLTKDYGTANLAIDDTKDIVDFHYTSSSSERLATSVCNGATVTLENTDNFATPDTLTIDFGSSNIFCFGKLRRGKMTAIRTAPYLQPASTTTISFDDYYVNNHKVEGSKTVTNNGVNSDGHLTFSITKDVEVSLTNGNEISWTANRTRIWIAGENTPLNFTDDIYQIEGNSSGNHSSGGSFSVTITTPITFDMNCWSDGACARVGGVTQVLPPNGNTRTIDYGNGTCNCNRTITVNGNSYNVTF